MQTYNISQFMFKDWDQWPCEENEKFLVALQDGVTFETDTAKMEVSSMFWGFFKEYKLLIATPEHFIRKAPISNKDIQNLQSRFIRDIHETYRARGYCKEEAWKVLEETAEEIYNTSILEYGEYLVGAGSIELSEIYHHPEIMKIRQNTKMNSKSISEGQKKTLQIMKTCPTLARNPFIIDLRTGNVKAEQFLQVILYRGFNTDLDDYIYKLPIMGNYFAGISDPAEVLMESTLAGKALLHQGAPLEQTEYANRMIQQSSAHVDLLIKGDCGSTAFAKMKVTSDLFMVMTGLYYKNDRGKLVPLSEDDTELIGETLEFRVPFYCGYRHMQCICETCYGDLAHSVPYGTNLGTIAATNSNSEVSQLVLKVKHSEDSADIEPINIPPRAQEYIYLSEDGEDIHVHQSLGLRDIKILIPTTVKDKIMRGSRLPVLSPDEITEANVHSISEFETISVEHPGEDGKRPIRYHIAISRGNRKSSLSVEFLRYMIAEECTINDDGDYAVSLANWNCNNPVFKLPRLHLSMRDFANETLSFIRSSSDSTSRNLSHQKQLRDYDDPTIALVDLATLFNSKVTVHMTHISIVMLSLMVSRDGSHGYYTPPLGVPTRFATYNEIQTNRSLGVLFAYQGGYSQINSNINQPLNTDRPPHLYDPLLLP